MSYAERSISRITYSPGVNTREPVTEAGRETSLATWTCQLFLNMGAMISYAAGRAAAYKPQWGVMPVKGLAAGARAPQAGFSVAAILRISSGLCSPASGVPGMRYWPMTRPPTSTGS